jgi:predicted pyridoxine 5'-phosphate oxidase superfamily flavin-nucleotide-binding protein
MRLAWERRGVVRMTVKVEELAALVAGARVAGHALAAQAGEQTEELERILGDFDRASLALKQSPDEAWFHAGSRSLQDRFGTRPLADRITQKFVKDCLEPGDSAFVERADMFFLATADAEGRPSCSYKGGDPGFVTVVGDRTIAFPNYDGNGMFLSWGNALANPEVGLLFIDFERGHRMRLNGTATIDGDDELMAAYPGAQFIVRVAIRDVFPNCPRYIHRYRLVERSKFVPHAGRRVPEPDWKQESWATDVLPTKS